MCQMIEILSAAELPRAREAGALVAGILQTLKSRCEVGTNLLDLDLWTQTMITEAGAQSCYVDYEPSFGRGPFGHHVCTSVNDAVLHGLPHDYALADGDLLTLDLAVSLGGVVADSAISFGVGSTMHQDPHIPNSGRPGRGYRLRPGLLLALEPWVMADTATLVHDADGWTLRSATGCRTAHSEHTIAITDDGAEVLTLPKRPQP
jgi:methionyl aminopeptidase